MIYALQNPYLQFALDPDQATWSLFNQNNQAPSVNEASLMALYRCERAPFQALDHWQPYQITILKKIPSQHGLLHQVCLSIGPDANGLHFTLLFALPEAAPLFLWKLNIENHGSRPVQINRLELLRVGPYRSPAYPNQNHLSAITNLKSNLAFFANGWQSWSYAGVYGPAERFRQTRLGFLRVPTDVNCGTPLPKRPGHFASDMFGVLGDRGLRTAILAGFLSQRQHFGSLEVWIDSMNPTLHLWANGDGARLDPGRQVATDWACLAFIDIDDPDPLGIYLNAVAQEHGLIPYPSSPSSGEEETGDRRLKVDRKGIPTGWCSWYQYSSNQYLGTITAEEARQNLAAMAALQERLPLQLFQIDDGFEAQVGDWFSFASSFPDGLAPLAVEIRNAGFTPGVWLAPFIVHPRSRLAAQHPDWLLRGRFNYPANAGFVWNSFATALDLTNPGALDYACQVIDTAVHRWGYSYLKLDFLYAAALSGRYQDPTCTRAQVLRRGLEALRRAAGEKAFLLGCGCPLGPAIGLVDAMRIGTDTSQRWQAAFSDIEFFFNAEPNIASAGNAINNALTRAPLHRRWWINDPDCLLLREETKLSRAELQTLATAVVLTGGSLLLSDDLTRLPEDRLRIAEVLLPLIGERPQVMDWFDASPPRRLRLDLENTTGPWHLLGLFNWKEKPADLVLRLEEFGLDPGREYFVRDFWNAKTYRLEMQATSRSHLQGALVFDNVPPHGVILLAVRPRNSDVPQYIGSNLHISQGLEVAEWRFVKGKELFLCLERPGPAQGEIELSLPQTPIQAFLDGIPVSWQPSLSGCYRFSIQFDRTAKLQLHWNL